MSMFQSITATNHFFIIIIINSQKSNIFHQTSSIDVTIDSEKLQILIFDKLHTNYTLNKSENCYHLKQCFNSSRASNPGCYFRLFPPRLNIHRKQPVNVLKKSFLKSKHKSFISTLKPWELQLPQFSVVVWGFLLHFKVLGSVKIFEDSWEQRG